MSLPTAKYKYCYGKTIKNASINHKKNHRESAGEFGLWILEVHSKDRLQSFPSFALTTIEQR